MGNNPLVQFVIQILIVGVIFHFIMGLCWILKIEKQDQFHMCYNVVAASWTSRNMIITGLVVLAFLVLLLLISGLRWFKYVEFSPLDETRYFHELVHRFENPFVLQFTVVILLSLHLQHGFGCSSFQSVGF
jgi:succinate dehydrogenase / fumarate reductase cytochrome b subunit